MTAETIEEMAAAIPDELLPEFFAGGRVPDMFSGETDRRLAKFLFGYQDVSFGWKYAQVFAKRGLPMPPILEARDEPLLQAYIYCRDSKHAGPDFLQALSLTSRMRTSAAKTIRALLVTRDVDLQELGGQLRFSPEALHIYQTLFFNVADRRDDVMYIRDIVYPDTRISEMLRDQFHNDEVGDILLRAGYDNGRADVMHLAGIADSSEMMMVASVESSKSFETLLMANAAVMARNGWVNLSKQSPTISNARQLVAAGKIGGDTSSKDNEGPSSMGASIMEDIRRTRMQHIARAELERAQNLQAQNL